MLNVRRRFRFAKQWWTIRKSGLFDSESYLKNNPDVARFRWGSLGHYLLFGATEGRDPHPLFCSSFYLHNNRDVAEAEVNPLFHYVRRGAAEKRDPHPLFDTSYYLEHNPDAAKARVNPLLHYVRYGAAEATNPHPSFDAQEYLRQNPDVVRSRANPLIHFLASRGSSAPAQTCAASPGAPAVMRPAPEKLAEPVMLAQNESGSASAKVKLRMLAGSRKVSHLLPPTESNLLNVPERELIERVVGGYWPESFLTSGQETADNIEFVLAKIGKSISSFEHILDFGCGCARTARFMIPYGAAEKPVCVDVDEAQIRYCKTVLPFLGEYILISDEPPMPLDAKRFDLIYSISTFTHFREDFQHHWLRELKRVSAPGGTLVLTIAGPRNRQYASTKDLERLESKGFSFLVGAGRGYHSPEYYHLALHSHAYVRRVWGEYFEILDIVPQVINNNQDAVLCGNIR